MNVLVLFFSFILVHYCHGIDVAQLTTGSCCQLLSTRPLSSV